jgi:hypothetical protein
MPEGRIAARIAARWNLVGTYRVERSLARGLAGAVHRARPLGGGPPVALRHLRADWSDRPAFAASWARCLLGASLVEHPNLAPLRDMGESGTTLHAAWDLVPGPTLGEILAAADRETALVALLQAARGLAALHDAGLWHGGIGPGAARGTIDDGVRLVDGGWPRDPDEPDDLGPVPLRRREAADERAVREAADAADAARRRADLDAFGKLLRGAKGIAGDRPLTELADRLAADPAAGPQPTAREVVVALESALGRTGGAFRPHPSEVDALREAATLHRDGPAARTWRMAVGIAAGVLALLIALAILAQAWLVAIGLAAFGALTAAACLVAGAIGQPDPILDRVRALAVGARTADLLAGAAVALLAVVVLGVIGAIRPLVVLALAAVALATLYRLEPHRRRREEERGPVEMVRSLVAGLRRQGVDEAAIRQFVRRDATTALFEAAFGTPPAGRPDGGPAPAEPPVDRAVRLLREGIVRALDRRLRRRRDGRLRELFVALEGRRQTAGGVNLLTARRRSWRVADALLAACGDLRAAMREGAIPAIGPALRAAAMAPEAVLIEHEATAAERRAIWGPLAAMLLGPRARFLVGSALLAGCVLWMHQNGMLPGARLRELAEQAAQVRDLEAARRVGAAAGALEVRLPGATVPLRAPGLPGTLARLASSLGAGMAGLVLVLSALRGGGRPLVLAWAGAIVALLIARGSTLNPATSLALATAAALGLLALFLPAPRRPTRGS